MITSRRVACAVLGLVASGCIRSTFVLTDTRYAGRPRTQPGVFIDRLPPFPYVSIGVIEVTAAAGSDLSMILKEAVTKGGEVGCDVVVDRSIHRIASMIPNAGPLVAQVGYNPAPVYTPAPVYGGAPPPDKREFICGLRLLPMPPPMPPPMRPPAAPPPPPGPAPGPAAPTPAPAPPAPAPGAMNRVPAVTGRG